MGIFNLFGSKPQKSKMEKFFEDLENDLTFKELNKQAELHLIEVRQKLKARTSFSEAQIEDYIEQYSRASQIAGFSRISLAQSIRENTNNDLSIIL